MFARPRVHFDIRNQVIAHTKPRVKFPIQNHFWHNFWPRSKIDLIPYFLEREFRSPEKNDLRQSTALHFTGTYSLYNLFFKKYSTYGPSR